MESSGAEPGPPQYALVSYIPEALGRFLNGLRRELVPQCQLLSHVTLLPPRYLTAPIPELVKTLGAAVHELPSFEIGLGSVEKFPVTDVVFIAVEEGRDILESLHRRLNQGPFASAEPFQFHPHVTVAQEIEPGLVEDAFQSATVRWADWSGERKFLVERLTFVHNGGPDGWITLAEFDLTRAELVLGK